MAKNQIKDWNNVYDKRMFMEYNMLDNPWSKKISSEEIKFLFNFFYYAAYFIDYLRNVPKKYNRAGIVYPPRTNLRFMCNIYNILSIFGLLILICFMLKAIFLYLI